MNGTGERKAYYKVETYSNLSPEEFIKKTCYPGSGLNKGDVSKVMCPVEEGNGSSHTNDVLAGSFQ